MRSHNSPEIIPALVASLRERDDKVLNQELQELIEANHVLGKPRHGFLYGGIFHTMLPSRSQAGAEKRQVHASLISAAKAHAARCAILDKEMVRITNGLSLVMRPCKDWQDVRDAVPDALKKVIPEIAHLPRLKEEAWALRDQPVLKHQYELTAELLLFYFTNRLLY